MTLLSEALADRKQLLSDIRDLSERWKNASVRYEDDQSSDESADDLEKKLQEKVEAFRDLQVRINRTNNETKVSFNHAEYTIMEAIALRESWLLLAKAQRATADHAAGLVKGRTRSLYGAARTKDDIRQVASIDIAKTREEADKMSLDIRHLDSAIQQKNWSTELL